MSIHNCEECKFITENKRDYQRHIKTKKHQKNVGEIENSKYTINIPQIYHKYTTDIPQGITNIPQDDNIIYECDYCDAGFKHKSGKYRHQKNYCKSKKTSDENIILTQKVEYLEKMLNDAMKHMNNTTNNNCTTNNIISINGYGKEDITYLTDKEWLKLLKNPRDSVKKLFLETHFNSEHPENKNIRQTNKKSKFIEVHDGDNWKNLNKKKILTDIADDKQGILDDKVAKNDDIYNSMSPRDHQNHDLFHDQIFEDEKNEIIEDLEGCLLDNM
tara:strand:+ start:161 stop:979 length:819 start_codon:yes stop_codon:yes gene_type:complete